MAHLGDATGIADLAPDLSIGFPASSARVLKAGPEKISDEKAGLFSCG